MITNHFTSTILTHRVRGKRPDLKRGLSFWTCVPIIGIVVASFIGFCAGVIPWWLNWLIATPCYCYVVICGHDAIHRAAHEDSRLNAVIGWMASVLFAIPFSVVRRAHLSHHAREGKPDDIERFAYLSGWTLPIRWIISNWMYYAILRKSPRREWRDTIVLLPAIVCLLARWPSMTLVGWFLPMQTASGILAIFTIYLPHGRFAKWIGKHAPFLTGYHEEHHAAPSYPWHQAGHIHR